MKRGEQITKQDRNQGKILPSPAHCSHLYSMPWLNAQLTVDKSQAPLVELLFEQLGALSVTLEDAADEPMLEPPPGATPLWSSTQVSGLFEVATDADALRARIHAALPPGDSRPLKLEMLQDQAWERAWLDHFQPMKFGRRLWICPTGRQVETPGATVVNLDPGLAFGTGTHPTTALCLEWLDGARLEGSTVIDYGCGSGILAVAALKLGAAEVIAVDHDPQALLATVSNAEINGVAERLTVRPGKQLEPRSADIVLANILANVLVELAPSIGALLKPGGKLVLSGILAEQAETVRNAYSPPLVFQTPAAYQEWILLQGEKS